MIENSFLEKAVKAKTKDRMAIKNKRFIIFPPGGIIYIPYYLFFQRKKNVPVANPHQMNGMGDISTIASKQDMTLSGSRNARIRPSRNASKWDKNDNMKVLTEKYYSDRIG